VVVVVVVAVVPAVVVHLLTRVWRFPAWIFCS
jgi:hypothetical protein